MYARLTVNAEQNANVKKKKRFSMGKYLTRILNIALMFWGFHKSFVTPLLFFVCLFFVCLSVCLFSTYSDRRCLRLAKITSGTSVIVL